MKIVLDTENIFHDVLLLIGLAVILHTYWYGTRFVRLGWTLVLKPFIDRTRRQNRKKKVSLSINGDKVTLGPPPSPNAHKDSSLPIQGKKGRIGLRLTSAIHNANGDKGHISPPTVGPSFLSNANGDIINHNEISYTRPSSKVKLEWLTNPQTVFIVKKWKDSYITKCVREVISWIQEEYPEISIMVEEDTFSELSDTKDIIIFDKSIMDQVDLIVCFGGDGTVLHISSLFQCSVPPIMAFALGSMGFLTPFNFKTYREDMRPVLKGKCFIKLRLRLHCVIIKKGVEQVETGFHALNEATIDRGASPFLSHLDCYCDDKHITTVQADGIIIATATGSTAYSLSSGGSLVHPLLPALLFTPICPHSLSFRPVVLPSSVTLKVMIPPESHCSASISFDGRNRQELQPGDGVILRISQWPIATVSKTDQIGDWFSSLAQHLNWNKRVLQKSNKKEKEEVRKEKEETRREKEGNDTSFSLRSSM